MVNLRDSLIGSVVLSGIFIIPLIAFWIISLVRVRRKNDPARVGFAWLKAVFILWILALVLRVIAGCLQLVPLFGDLYRPRTSREAERALDHIATTGDLVYLLANILLFVTLVEIAGGYIICVNGPSVPSLSRNIPRAAMLAWAFILLVLAITEFGLDQSLATRWWEDDNYTFRDRLEDEIIVYRLLGALVVLSWLTTLPLLGYGAFVVHKTRANPLLRSGAILLLVCVILDFLRHLVNMAIFIDYQLINLADNLYPGTSRPFSEWYIVKPSFDKSLMFIILLMLFSLGLRKRNGLWSQPPPEWNYPPPQAMVSFPAYAGMPAQGMPPQPYQQQQQPFPPQQPGQGMPAYPQPAQQGQCPAPQGYYYYQSQPTLQQQQQQQK